MFHKSVVSSNLLSVAYENHVLEIRFRSGGCYRYHNVPKSVYLALMNAPSKGKYFARHIKPFYPYYKVY